MSHNESSSEGTTVKPPKLHRDDYRMWKKRMTSFLVLYDIQLWKVINEGPHVPTIAVEGTSQIKPKDPEHYSVEDHQKLLIDEKAKAVLYMALPGDLLENVFHCNSAKEIWDCLSDLLEGTADVRNNMARMLVQRYECFAHESGETLTHQYERFVKLISQLKSHDKSYPIDELSIRFMRSLPPQWKAYTTIIKKTNTLETMTLAQLYGELRTYELEVEQDAKLNQVDRGKSSSMGSAALVSSTSSSEPFVTLPVDDIPRVRVTEVFDDSPVEDIDNISAEDLEEAEILHMMAFVSMRMRKFTRKTGRTFAGKRGTVNKIVRGFDKSRLTCFNCKKPGHFASECREPRAPGSTFGQTQKTQPSYQKPAFQQPQKAFVSDEFDWSFTNEEGETFALMASLDEVKSNNPQGEDIIHCSPECLDRFHLLKDELAYQKGLSKSYLADLNGYPAKIQIEIEKRILVEKERYDLENKVCDLKASLSYATDLLKEANKKLEEKEALVAKWQESSHAFQRIIKQHEKYNLHYGATPPPSDYSIKTKPESDNEGVNVGTIKDPVILEDVTDEVETPTATKVV